jgi:hypothetical protein
MVAGRLCSSCIEVSAVAIIPGLRRRVLKFVLAFPRSIGSNASSISDNSSNSLKENAR